MRFALGIDYDGSQYHGWQTQQEGVPSIQSAIEQALSKVANHPVILHGAGRTDAGVHASGMVAHFDTHAVRGHKSWLLLKYVHKHLFYENTRPTRKRLKQCHLQEKGFGGQYCKR
jgi:tRNA pseudouridine(38-40) synthase